jgi:hypothetical protein
VAATRGSAQATPVRLDAPATPESLLRALGALE